MRRWRSGQSHLTVNQTTYVYAGSNPARRTNNKNRRQRPKVFILCGREVRTVGAHFIMRVSTVGRGESCSAHK